MDEFAFYSSQQENKTEFIFQNLQHVYVPDQNSGSYPNGQVLFDLASLSNSGKYIDFQQSYITVPLVANMNVTGSTPDLGGENAFALSLKNGFHQLINSMSVEITNCQVVNLTNFSNLDINYKLLTTSSIEDERNFLPSINFCKDTVESITYKPAADAGGVGECNNVIKVTPFASTTGYGTSGINSNAGRLERMKNTSFDPVATAIGSLVNENVCKTVGKNYTASTLKTDQTYYILATIPLKILHDLFKKLPLTKGMYMRLILNLNTQCQSTITLNAGTTFTTYATTSLNNVFPVMVSPLLTSNGVVVTGATKIVASLGIGKGYGTTLPFNHPVMSSCRFYARACEMTPMYEEIYLSAIPTKKILYNDILSFTSFNNASNSTVSQVLTNGISRPRSILIIPQLAGTVNGSALATLATAYSAGVGVLGSPMNSPFSSSPATTGFQAAISNLNILVSGQNIYQSNQLYGFEQFLQEVRGSNAINGGIPLGLTSGLLSQTDWENGYRYCYVDLSRRLSQANDDISRSIQVSFTNSAVYAADYIMIINYEKEIVISTSTGALII